MSNRYQNPSCGSLEMSFRTDVSPIDFLNKTPSWEVPPSILKPRETVLGHQQCQPKCTKIVWTVFLEQNLFLLSWSQRAHTGRGVHPTGLCAAFTLYSQWTFWKVGTLFPLSPPPSGDRRSRDIRFLKKGQDFFFSLPPLIEVSRRWWDGAILTFLRSRTG